MLNGYLSGNDPYYGRAALLLMRKAGAAVRCLEDAVVTFKLAVSGDAGDPILKMTFDVSVPPNDVIVHSRLLVSPETDLSELHLSNRAERCLRDDGINTVGELMQNSANDLGSVRNFNDACVREVQEKLSLVGGFLK